MLPDDGVRPADPDASWLLLRSQAGDRQALEDLLRLTQRKLRPYVIKMMGEESAASDVMQQVLLTVFRKLGTLQEPRAFWGWARRIASRAVMHALGERWRQATITSPLPEEIEDLTVSPDEVRGWEQPLLARLPPHIRDVLVLHYWEDLTLKEIGPILDLPVGTVKSRLATGLRLLRAYVKT